MQSASTAHLWRIRGPVPEFALQPNSGRASEQAGIPTWQSGDLGTMFAAHLRRAGVHLYATHCHGAWRPHCHTTLAAVESWRLLPRHGVQHRRAMGRSQQMASNGRIGLARSVAGESVSGESFSNFGGLEVWRTSCLSDDGGSVLLLRTQGSVPSA